MNSVFLGGSRKLSRLNSDIRSRFENIIEKGFEVLVGDANGSDKAVQAFFAERKYVHVSVYCSGQECRNNLGRWAEVHVDPKRSKKDRVYYAAKDSKMADDCGYGFMLWDGESSGTLNNVVNVLHKNKPCMIYVSPHREFKFLRNWNDFEPLLRSLPHTVIAELDRKIDLRDRVNGLIEGSQKELAL
jgi:hypothetical protein